jgi:hypothetical protein
MDENPFSPLRAASSSSFALCASGISMVVRMRRVYYMHMHVDQMGRRPSRSSILCRKAGSFRQAREASLSDHRSRDSSLGALMGWE